MSEARHYNMRSLAERFWLNVSVGSSAECWEWTGSLDREGYGRLRNGQRRTVSAHRAAYQLLVGPIPPGMVIDHMCFHRNCVNPLHLRTLTSRANSRNRATDPGVRPEEECMHGHQMTSANTYVNPRGNAECRTCRRESETARRRRLQGAAA